MTYHRRARQYAAEYPALSRHRNLCRVALDLALLPAEGQHGPDRGQDLLRDGACDQSTVFACQEGVSLNSVGMSYYQSSQNDSRSETDCVVSGSRFHRAKSAANDNKVGVNLKTGVIMRALHIIISS